MRYLARVDEEDIKAIIGTALSVDENKIDICVDADHRVVAWVEMGDLDLKKEINNGTNNAEQ